MVGVVLSHPHQDHWGLAPQLPAWVPVYIGARAHELLARAAFFSPAGVTLEATGYLNDRKPLDVGPFRVTPFLVDHSAFDAYSLLVEADGKRLFYSGDFRGHGRKRELFERLIRHRPEGIDVLLLEGTTVPKAGATGREEVSEDDVERSFSETVRRTEGLVLAVFSSQNIDRLVTLFRGAKRAGREFVMDLYTAEMASATGVASILKGSWANVHVYVPWNVRRRIRNAQRFDLIDGIRADRISADEIARRPGDFVMAFRGSMARDMEVVGCLRGARVVWSLWAGYLDRDSRFRGFCERNGLEIVHHHSSGHAFIGDLQRVVQALSPRRVVPIHSAAPERFSDLFPRVEQRSNGEWWSV